MLLIPTEQPSSSTQLGDRMHHFDGVNSNRTDDGLGSLRPTGIPAPATAPTAAAGAAGNVPDGVHLIYVTFVYIRDGTVLVESNPSPVLSYTVTGGPIIVNLSSVPTSTHPTVNGRCIYVTSADGTTAVKVTTAAAEILDNTTTTFAYNVADASLSSLVLSTANEQLPTAAYGLAFGNRLIVGGATAKAGIVLSVTNSSTAFSALGGTAITSGDVGKSVVFPDNHSYLIATVSETAQTGTLTVAYQGTTATPTVSIVGDPALVTIGNALPLNIEAYDPLGDSQIIVGGDDGMPLRAIAPFYQTLVFGKSRAIYQLSGQLITSTTGTSGPSYSVDIISSNVGIVSHFAACPLRGHSAFLRGALIFYGGDGVYILEGTQPTKVSTVLNSLFDTSQETPVLLGTEDCRVDHSMDATAHALYDPSSQMYYLWVARKARVTPVTATATATVAGGVITTVAMTNVGAGYAYPPSISIMEGRGNATLTPVMSKGTVTSVIISGTNTGYTTATLVFSAPAQLPKMLDMCIVLDFKRYNSRRQPSAWVFLIPATLSRIEQLPTTGNVRLVVGNYHSKVMQLFIGWRDGVPLRSTGNTNYQFRVSSVIACTHQYSTRLVIDNSTTGYAGFPDITGGVAGTPIVGVSGSNKGAFRVARSLFLADSISLPGAAAPYFVASTSATMNVGDTFSLVGWIKLTAIGSRMDLISRGANGYDVYVSTGGALVLTKETVAIIVTSTANFTAGAWHMFAVTKTGATVKLYIDGADVTGVVTNQTISATGGNTAIGFELANNYNTVNGGLSQFALWSLALSAANITTLYAAATAGGYSALVLSLTPNAYWRMNELSGDLVDSSGNSNTMTANGSPTYQVVGPIPTESVAHLEVDEARSGPSPFNSGDIITVGGYHAYWASNEDTAGSEGTLKRGSRLKTTFSIPAFTTIDI